MPYSFGRPDVEKEKWKHIEQFVESFNKHRQQYVVPSQQLCVESVFKDVMEGKGYGSI